MTRPEEAQAQEDLKTLSFAELQRIVELAERTLIEYRHTPEVRKKWNPDFLEYRLLTRETLAYTYSLTSSYNNRDNNYNWRIGIRHPLICQQAGRHYRTLGKANTALKDKLEGRGFIIVQDEKEETSESEAPTFKTLLNEAVKLAQTTLQATEKPDGSIEYYQATTRNSIRDAFAYTRPATYGYLWKIAHSPLSNAQSGIPHSNTIQEANAALRSRLLEIGFRILE